MICMTLDSVRPTQSSVIQIITTMLVWSVFLQFYQNIWFFKFKYLFFLIINIYAYLIYISVV